MSGPLIWPAVPKVDPRAMLPSRKVTLVASANSVMPRFSVRNIWIAGKPKKEVAPPTAPVRMPLTNRAGRRYCGWMTGRKPNSCVSTRTSMAQDRKSVVEGKRGYVGVDLGGERKIQKKNKHKKKR